MDRRRAGLGREVVEDAVVGALDDGAGAPRGVFVRMGWRTGGVDAPLEVGAVPGGVARVEDGCMKTAGLFVGARLGSWDSGGCGRLGTDPDRVAG